MWKIPFMLGFGAGVLFGLYIYHNFYKQTYKKFRDEMHRQYLYLLKKHNIPIKEDSEQIINS